MYLFKRRLSVPTIHPQWGDVPSASDSPWRQRATYQVDPGIGVMMPQMVDYMPGDLNGGASSWVSSGVAGYDLGNDLKSIFENESDPDPGPDATDSDSDVEPVNGASLHSDNEEPLPAHDSPSVHLPPVTERAQRTSQVRTRPRGKPHTTFATTGRKKAAKESVTTRSNRRQNRREEGGVFRASSAGGKSMSDSRPEDEYESVKKEKHNAIEARYRKKNQGQEKRIMELATYYAKTNGLEDVKYQRNGLLSKADAMCVIADYLEHKPDFEGAKQFFELDLNSLL